MNDMNEERRDKVEPRLICLRVSEMLRHWYCGRVSEQATGGLLHDASPVPMIDQWCY
jgi:hypothetical protein